MLSSPLTDLSWKSLDPIKLLALLLASIRLAVMWEARLTYPLGWWMYDWQMPLELSDGTAFCRICHRGWNLFRHTAYSLVCGSIQCLSIQLGYVTGNRGYRRKQISLLSFFGHLFLIWSEISFWDWMCMCECLLLALIPQILFHHQSSIKKLRILIWLKSSKK